MSKITKIKATLAIAASAVLAAGFTGCAMSPDDVATLEQQHSAPLSADNN